MPDRPPIRRRVVLALAALMVPAVARGAASDAVREPIRVFYAALEAQMQAGRGAPFRQRFDALAPVVNRVFNLDTILRVSVGSRWSTLDANAQATLDRAFRRFTIASYVANFDRNDDEKFEILPDVRPAGADRIVSTRIIARDGEATRLDYQMHHDDKGWRVTDILLNGTISRVAVQRSDFRRLLSAGDASALIASLRQKIVDLSGGSLTS